MAIDPINFARTTQVRLRRGTTAQIAANPPVEAEPFYDATEQRMGIGGGSDGIVEQWKSEFLEHTADVADAVPRNLQEKLTTEILSVRDFGAVGDGVTDDTAAIQKCINFARDNKGVAYAPPGEYRITSSIKTQHDGNFKPIKVDFFDANIVADFSGSPALIVTGGAQIQDVSIKVSASDAHKFSGTYDSSSVGVFILDSKVRIRANVYSFSGDGVLIGSDNPNSNTSEYDLECFGNGRGVLVTGSNDNISVCRSKFLTFGNGLEGVRVSDVSAMREWTGFWYAENNWTTDPNNASNYGVYIGKATKCDLWIYSEQYLLASEIFLNKTNATFNRIFSARANKDTINGTNYAWRGNEVYQNDYNGASGAGYRNSEPIVVRGLMARVDQPGEYVRLPFRSLSGADFGYISGENEAIHIESEDGTKKISVSNDFLRFGVSRAFSGTEILSFSPNNSRVISLFDVSLFSSVCGRIRISGRSGAGTGHKHLSREFFISQTSMTLIAPTIDDEPVSNAPVFTLAVSGTDVQLTISYNPAAWGAQYAVSYYIEVVGG